MYGVRKTCLSSGWSLLLYKFTRKVIKLSVVVIEAYHRYQLLAKLFVTSFS
jgi:hypothetical protein